MLDKFYYFQIFILGLCIGSFLNVIIFRFPNNLSIIKPRSHCPSCKAKLTWKENIPLVSWLIQRGKCVSCNKFISTRYPFIELKTAILFVIFTKSSPTLLTLTTNNLLFITILSWIFISILICIALIDIDHFWIPQGLINFGILSGILGLISTDIFDNKFIDFNLFLRVIFGSIISFIVFEAFRKFAKYIFKKDAIGKGDSKLVAMLAIWLGPLGTLFAVAISYVFAAIYCLLGLSANLLKFRQAIPFAPFLSLGGGVVWFFGNSFLIEKILRI